MLRLNQKYEYLYNLRLQWASSMNTTANSFCFVRAVIDFLYMHRIVSGLINKVYFPFSMSLRLRSPSPRYRLC